VFILKGFESQSTRYPRTFRKSLSRINQSSMHSGTVDVRVGEAVEIRFLWRPLLSDPADDMVLESAVHGRADLLVTFNQKDFAAVAESFALKISPPSEALHRLRALAKE
jgi:predicted nucleic acid-binding protein